MKIAPEGYPLLSPYLIVENAAGFIPFVQSVFGAQLQNHHLRDETIVMHAELKIGDSIIMLADSTPEYPPATANLFIYVENADATYERALQEGAVAVTPMGDQSYGRSGGVKDAFGNTWWITAVK